jgi:hypothetical protein
MTKIILDLPDDQAMALAQMCKRFCWEDAVRCDLARSNCQAHAGRRP